ncbi:14962_t:CDS:2 [Entrophospora sp. SA101]|nr:14962_t:CDS:2 [Entrophospora sp. SA101]
MDIINTTTVGAIESNALDISIDSLPYYDQEIEYEGMGAKVDKLIEQEMRKRPTSIKRDIKTSFPDIELFKYQRVEQGTPMTRIDLNRYRLEEPKDTSDIEEWIESINNSKSQASHQDLRSMNLELLLEYGSNAWRIHNFQLEQYLRHLEASLDRHKQKSFDLNRQRKAEQLEVGRQIEMLDNKWSELIGETIQLEVACSTLQHEISELKIYQEKLKKESESKKFTL